MQPTLVLVTSNVKQLHTPNDECYPDTCIPDGIYCKPQWPGNND